MKKLLLLIALLTFFINANAQKYYYPDQQERVCHGRRNGKALQGHPPDYPAGYQFPGSGGVCVPVPWGRRTPVKHGKRGLPPPQGTAAG